MLIYAACLPIWALTVSPILTVLIYYFRMHRGLAKDSALREFMLYDTSTRQEYEANIVAAEILLDTDEVLDCIYRRGYTSEQIARAMETDVNLVALKISHLAEAGYDLRRIEHRSDFLK